MIRKFEKNENGDRRDYVMADVAIEADVCLKVSGDSMKGARILDGDRVFIRKQDPVFRRSTRKVPSFSSRHFFISFPASRFFLYLQQIFNALLGLFLLKKFF